MKTSTQSSCRAIDNRLVFILFFPTLFLLFSFKSFQDNGGSKLGVIRKQLKVDSAFKGIRIDGDISVILTNDPAGTVFIEGKANELEKINAGFEKSIFIIDAGRKPLFAKLTLYLSAITLQTIQLNGDGNISSSDFIQSEHLHISLNGDIKVDVKTLGELSFDTPDEIELRSNSAAHDNSKKD